MCRFRHLWQLKVSFLYFLALQSGCRIFAGVFLFFYSYHFFLVVDMPRGSVRVPVSAPTSFGVAPEAAKLQDVMEKVKEAYESKHLESRLRPRTKLQVDTKTKDQRLPTHSKDRNTTQHRHVSKRGGGGIHKYVSHYKDDKGESQGEEAWSFAVII